VHPEDVVSERFVFASPAASWITGEVLYVAGGQQIQGPNQALFAKAFPERGP
jgi:hypothetical protein